MGIELPIGFSPPHLKASLSFGILSGAQRKDIPPTGLLQTSHVAAVRYTGTRISGSAGYLILLL